MANAALMAVARNASFGSDTEFFLRLSWKVGAKGAGANHCAKPSGLFDLILLPKGKVVDAHTVIVTALACSADNGVGVSRNHTRSGSYIFVMRRIIKSFYVLLFRKERRKTSFHKLSCKGRRIIAAAGLQVFSQSFRIVGTMSGLAFAATARDNPEQTTPN